jgi:hypothetical protein
MQEESWLIEEKGGLVKPWLAEGEIIEEGEDEEEDEENEEDEVPGDEVDKYVEEHDDEGEEKDRKEKEEKVEQNPPPEPDLFEYWRENVRFEK